MQLANDHTRRRRALAWINGVGRLDRAATALSEAAYVKLLLTGEALDGPGQAKTGEAEAAMHWPESLYWYVGTVCEEYGSIMVGEWNPPTEIAVEETYGSICPFDTGSLAGSSKKFDPGCGDGASYVQEHVKPLHYWHQEVRDRLNESYEDVLSYVDGAPPKRPTTRLDHASATSDARAWTWEARLAKDQWSDPAGRVSHTYWASETDRAVIEAALNDRANASNIDTIADALELLAKESTVCRGAVQHRVVREELRRRVT